MWQWKLPTSQGGHLMSVAEIQAYLESAGKSAFAEENIRDYDFYTARDTGVFAVRKGKDRNYFTAIRSKAEKRVQQRQASGSAFDVSLAKAEQRMRRAAQQTKELRMAERKRHQQQALVTALEEQDLANRLGAVGVASPCEGSEGTGSPVLSPAHMRGASPGGAPSPTLRFTPTRGSSPVGPPHPATASVATSPLADVQSLDGRAHAELRALQEAHERVQQQLGEAKVRSARLQEQQESAERDVADLLPEAARVVKVESEFAQVEKQLKTATARVAELERELAQAKSVTARLEEQLDVATRRVGAAEARAEEAEAATGQIEAVETRAEAAETRAHSHKAALEAVLQKLKATEAERGVLVEGLQLQLEAAEARAQGAEARAQDAEARAKALELDLKERKELDLAALRSNAENVRGQILPLGPRAA